MFLSSCFYMNISTWWQPGSPIILHVLLLISQNTPAQSFIKYWLISLRNLLSKPVGDEESKPSYQVKLFPPLQ